MSDVHDAQSSPAASDSESDEETAVVIESSSGHRAQNEHFQSLLSRAASNLTIKEKVVNSNMQQLETSTRQLLRTQGFAATIHDPREYQIELYEKAKKENTIAVLDTGSGKTLIAVLLLKHVIQNELIARDRNEHPRISFFLVNSVALVFQQSAVLKNNIDQPVTPMIGSSGLDLWNKETWEKTLRESMIIVCTADILDHSLLNSYVRMEDINLLIFDEAHHAKKEHAYARIVKDSYLKSAPAYRPRIFGMTASPIDAKGDVIKASQDLELLLDSKIATTSNLTLLRQVVNRPEEETWTYPKINKPFKTTLYEILEKNYGDIECLKKLFCFSFRASAELGKWCADRVWSHALGEATLPKFYGKLNTSIRRLPTEEVTGYVEREKARITDMSQQVSKYKLGRGDCIFEHLSPKVQILVQKLSKFFEGAPDTKCIVFTKQRYTARLLEDVFKELEIANLIPGLLIGVRSGDHLGMNSTYHHQFKTMMRFRKGEINCLFATSVAEEGLDIPDCNLVVRFDLYDTLIQYVQSRGRARHFSSTYAHMVERDNLEHEDRLEEVWQAEVMMRRFCECLPTDRILGSDEVNEANNLLDAGPKTRQYIIEKTGARLTYHSALTILARYASSLQYENEVCAQAHYVVSPAQGMYKCEVILPETSPVRGLVGQPESSKSIAKKSAAYDTCILLRKQGLLDDNFMSAYHRRLPAMRNAKLAIMSKKTNQYLMMMKPVFWKRGYGVEPNSLYITIISLHPARPLQKAYRSILLLTREPLPQFPEFPIYLEDNIKTTIRLTPLTEPLTVSPKDLHLMTIFTLRIFRDLYNKIYENDATTFSYWLLPASTAFDLSKSNLEPFDTIDWESLRFVDEHDDIPRSFFSPEDMVGRFVYDRWNGKYRYFLTGINKSLTPSDPPPAYLRRRRHMENIMSYGLSLFKNSRATFLETCDWQQAVFDANLISLRRNLLDEMNETEKEFEDRSLVCLEYTIISALPASVVTTCFAFPAILTRLESYLIAQECCDSLDLTVNLSYALEAITKDSDNTDEHRSQQIHVQRGMGKNYERLEFLGDCFLKMATSISLFAQNPFDQEFDFHVNRMCLVCNRNLFNTAKKRKLYEFIRSKGFSRRNWYPEGMKLLKGKANENSASSVQALGEKTIADVCEAIIGASLLSGGPEHRFDMAVKAVTALVNDKTHGANKWTDYYQLYSLPPYQARDADGSEKDLARKMESKLGYLFRYPTLLRSAFTHPSFPAAWSRVPCYQRLEFLGDSLLDMVCVEDLYRRFPDRDPQWLTEHKMAMVSNKFLGALAVQLGLHSHLQYFSSPLQNQIARYVEEYQVAAKDPDGIDFWLDTEDPPKCLPDMVEAYLGAIFVDSEFDFGVIESFFEKHIKPYFEDMTLYDTFANKHPTTFLANTLTTNFGCVQFSLKAGEIPSADGAPPVVLAAVLVHDVVLAQAMASSARYAKLKASQSGLEKLEGLTLNDFREQYHCSCSRGAAAEQGDVSCAK